MRGGDDSIREGVQRRCEETAREVAMPRAKLGDHRGMCSSRCAPAGVLQHQAVLKLLAHRTTSSLRSAAGPIAFSARHSSKCSAVPPVPMATAAWKAPSSPAAPPQSAFIPPMPSFGLSASPPVS